MTGGLVGSAVTTVQGVKDPIVSFLTSAVTGTVSGAVGSLLQFFSHVFLFLAADKIAKVLFLLVVQGGVLGPGLGLGQGQGPGPTALGRPVIRVQGPSIYYQTPGAQASRPPVHSSQGPEPTFLEEEYLVGGAQAADPGPVYYYDYQGYQGQVGAWCCSRWRPPDYCFPRQRRVGAGTTGGGTAGL
jgi:hypothetical protein